MLIFSAMWFMYLDFASLTVMSRSLEASLSCVLVVSGQGLVEDLSSASRVVTLSMVGWMVFLLSSNQSLVGSSIFVAVDVVDSVVDAEKFWYFGWVGCAYVEPLSLELNLALASML